MPSVINVFVNKYHNSTNIKYIYVIDVPLMSTGYSAAGYPAKSLPVSSLTITNYIVQKILDSN